MISQSFKIDQVYLESSGVIVSKKEKEGPLGKYFNEYIDDYYFGVNTFEKAQIKLCKAAISKALAKSSYTYDDILIAFGGDLSNQIFSSTSTVKEENFPFVGLYAACASGVLAMILASLYMMQTKIENALAFTSSHVCVSQRQLRYPNEYASLVKNTTTNTITGAGAVILSNQKSKIKLSKASIGKVIDILSNNVNDLGTCMAYAAIDTLKTHFNNFNETIDDYDLIVTGDLSEIGTDVFKKELLLEGINVENKHFDCGKEIYNKESQKTSAGGSGPACVMCVCLTYLLAKMKKEKYKKVLIIGTGALHSQISYQQKESIPCIAHAIVWEVEE